jgi:4,5-dihydroxyphthalate decarboxylase
MSERLSIAVGSYDHVRDLVSGRLRPEGIEPTFIELEIEQILQRFAHLEEWDVSEFSLAQYVARRARDDESIIAIPVFPSRVFRHGSIFVRPGTMEGPADLVGRRVGIPEWVQTAGVWMRGILEREYRVDLAEVEWVQAGVNEAGRGESIAPDLPAGVRVESRPEDTLDEMLRTGEIDAVLSARPPRGFDGERVVRLVTDHVEVEREWWRRTGIYPIMHVIVLRAAPYRRSPWIAASLTEAFTEAKRRGVERLRELTASRIAMPWIAEQLEELEPLFGTDWWPYGVAGNRATLEAFLDFSHRQGVARRRLEVEELFAPETLFEARV